MKIVEDIKVILLFQLIYQLQNARSSFEDSASEVEESQELRDSAASSEEQRHSHKHRHVHRAGHRRKKSRSSQSHNHEHDHEHDHVHTHVRTTSNEYNDDCECDCNKCDTPSNCCKSACNTCPSGTPYQQPTQGMTGQSSVVFVPYPVPMMMPSPIVTPAPNHYEMMRARESKQEPTITSTTTSTTTTSTTTTAITTTTTTTTTENPADMINSQHNSKILEAVLKSVVDDYSKIIAKTPDKLPNGNNKYMLTSLRRTKPTWMPKFGIVPISNNIAEKLMSKMSRGRVPLRTQQKGVSMYDNSNFRNGAKNY